MKSKKKLIVISFIVVVILAAMILPRYLKPKEVPDAVPPPTVQVSLPETGSIELFTALTGKIEPSDMVSIIPKMAGEVTEVLVKPGDMVKEGQILCRIDTKQVDGAKLNLKAAEIALADAKTNLSRMQALYDNGDISAQNYEQVQSGVKSAQIQYDSAKLGYDTQMEYSTITAPISGLVESTNMEVHDMVSQQNLICVITGEGSKAVSFSVTERVVKNLKTGDTIRIEKNGEEHQGAVTEVSSMIDAATGLFKIKASIEGGEALATGSDVKLHVISERVTDAMTLPVDCVYYDGGASYLYTLDNGIVHKLPIEVGIYDSEKIQIVSGVAADDQVITTWSPELYEGAPAVAVEQ